MVSSLYQLCGISSKNVADGFITIFGDSRVYRLHILEKRGNIYFKDPSEGVLFDAVWYLNNFQKKDNAFIRRSLSSMGMSEEEIVEFFDQSTKFNKLCSFIKAGRASYDYMRSAGRISTRYGDWAIFSKQDLINIFGIPRELGKKNTTNLVEIIRDECAIPVSVNVFSINDSFVGAIPLTSGNCDNLLSFSRTVDNRPWRLSRVFLCESPDVASWCEATVDTTNGAAIGLIRQARGVPDFGDAGVPSIYCVLGPEEPPQKILNFYSRKGGVLCHRISSNITDGSVAYNSNFFRDPDLVADLCVDAATYAARQNKQAIEFIEEFVTTASVCRQSKVKFLESYAENMGIDKGTFLHKEGLRSALQIPIDIGGFTYFTSDGRFARSGKRGPAKHIANFCIYPLGAYLREEGQLTFHGKLSVEGQSCDVFLDHKDFHTKDSVFIERLQEVSSKNDIPFPVVLQRRDIKHIKTLLIKSFSDTCPTIRIESPGFSGSTRYISSGWTATLDGVVASQQINSKMFGEIHFPLVHVPHGYIERMESKVEQFANASGNKDFLTKFAATVRAYLSKGTATMLVPPDELENIASLFECKIQEHVLPHRCFQISRNDCTEKFAQEHGVFLVTSEPSSLRVKDAIIFENRIAPMEKQESLLPFFLYASLSRNYSVGVRGSDRLLLKKVDDAPITLLRRYIRENPPREDDDFTLIEVKPFTKWLKNFDPKITTRTILDSLDENGIKYIYPIRKGKRRTIHILLFRGQF